MKRLVALNDYCIDGYMQQIKSLDNMISDINARTYAMVKANPDVILKSIPGVRGLHSTSHIVRDWGNI